MTKKKTQKERDAERLKRAQEIADGLKRGFYHPGFAPEYVPPPKPKKDEEAIRQIYGETPPDEEKKE